MPKINCDICIAMNAERVEKIKKWAKRLGFWGFVFFLAKGLVWLAIFYFAANKIK